MDFAKKKSNFFYAARKLRRMRNSTVFIVT